MGVAKAFVSISESTEDYPPWFSEGKTRLIPKSGKFTSENQRPITCLNNMYKWVIYTVFSNSVYIYSI